MTPSDADRYPIKNALVWIAGRFQPGRFHPGRFQSDDCPDDRLAQAAASIPALSNPFAGGYYITQRFGGAHYGVDWGIPVGTPLYAVHAGQVVTARQDWTGYGWVISIKSDALGLYSVYGHLNGRSALAVRVGQWVDEREHIGYSGNTGNSTGPHLHLELRIPPYAYPRNCVNPLPYLQAWSATPPPASGGKWRVVKAQVSIYAGPGMGYRVVGHYQAGQVVTAESAGGVWLKTDAGYVMRQNKAKTLMVRA